MTAPLVRSLSAYRRNVRALPYAACREKPAALVCHDALTTFAAILILPIADRLDSKWPDRAIERAELVIIERNAQPKIVEDGHRAT